MGSADASLRALGWPYSQEDPAAFAPSSTRIWDLGICPKATAGTAGATLAVLLSGHWALFVSRLFCESVPVPHPHTRLPVSSKRRAGIGGSSASARMTRACHSQGVLSMLRVALDPSFATLVLPSKPQNPQNRAWHTYGQ